MPTPAQIRAEVEDAAGPLFAQYAPHWAAVFPAEPEPPEGDPARPRWLRIAPRFGTLLPDAAFAIHALLTSRETGRAIAARTLSRGAFLGRLAPFAVRILSLDDAKRAAWSMALQMLAGGDDVIDITRPEIQGMLDAATADGLLTAPERAGFVNAGTMPCSRAEELGWGPFAYDLVALAKGA
jgi:hypothetical protein